MGRRGEAPPQSDSRPDARLISPKKLANLLSWKHSGFSIHHGGEESVPAHDVAGRKRLAEYLLRHPFSLQKITWNATSKTVIYRSKRHHTTKRNFEIFKAPFFAKATNGRPVFGIGGGKLRMPALRSSQSEERSLI